ncbi:hypothetical protein NDU88_006352 [Pleurodeles waltl]|uniref:Uncharacterized protein n=1 Tax=Pleurodeles waltl TaxID=8319 RepID=A0AAV7SPC5_PLEWA|nr:hypothetical protein NDU88_006352 [Pleurodeles waltl]
MESWMRNGEDVGPEKEDEEELKEANDEHEGVTASETGWKADRGAWLEKLRSLCNRDTGVKREGEAGELLRVEKGIQVVPSSLIKRDERKEKINTPIPKRMLARKSYKDSFQTLKEHIDMKENNHC